MEIENTIFFSRKISVFVQKYVTMYFERMFNITVNLVNEHVKQVALSELKFEKKKNH